MCLAHCQHSIITHCLMNRPMNGTSTKSDNVRETRIDLITYKKME